MEHKKKREKGGFYIAICCCIVIIAMVGYANRISLKDNAAEQKETAQGTQIPAEKSAVREEKILKSENVQQEEEKQEPVSGNVKTEEKVIFNAPVKGKIIESFSGDDLVYNEALKDWRAHSGVDFSAEIGEQVLCSANGVVEDVFDSNMGRCVVINHQNGFKTMYANLNEDTKVSKGEEVSQGDVIGAVGDTALGDSTNEPHLHFEISENEEVLDPADYIE